MVKRTKEAIFSEKYFFTQKNSSTISSEIRSLAREEQEIELGGGEKVDRPLAQTRKSFPKRKALKDYFLFWELSTQRSTMSRSRGQDCRDGYEQAEREKEL